MTGVLEEESKCCVLLTDSTDWAVLDLTRALLSVDLGVGGSDWICLLEDLSDTEQLSASSHSS